MDMQPDTGALLSYHSSKNSKKEQKHTPEGSCSQLISMLITQNNQHPCQPPIVYQDLHCIIERTCSAQRLDAFWGSPSDSLRESVLADNASDSCSIANAPLLTSISLLLSQASFTFLRQPKQAKRNKLGNWMRFKT